MTPDELRCFFEAMPAAEHRALMDLKFKLNLISMLCSVPSCLEPTNGLVYGTRYCQTHMKEIPGVYP